MTTSEAVPPARRATLRRIIEAVEEAEKVVLTTHVNADGDGAGSEAAVAAWLQGRGTAVHIVNPTPFPELFRFLVPDAELILRVGTPAADAALAGADLLMVLDTAEKSRIGRIARAAEGRAVVIIDHHVPAKGMIDGVLLQDVAACATGELIYDLMVEEGLPRPWPRAVLEGIYTAIVTDTGSFRFSNTTRRAHEVTGDLIEQGVDPELMFRRIYATVPLHRIELLRHALERLEVDAQHAITSITLERDVMERLGASSEDLDGIIDHARSIEGTEVAILFRETSDGATKVSLRSAGLVDVNAIARELGGGGHVKAAGALLRQPLQQARALVLEATRAALGRAGAAFPPPRSQA